ncbi:MAG: metallophosphoesterase [Lachnospirales bacterium]
MKIKNIAMSMAALGALGVGAIHYGKYVERKRLIKKEYNLNIKYKIAVFSDTHFGNKFNENNINKIVNIINKEKVDFVFFVGDLFDRFNTYGEGEEIISCGLKKMQAKYGKYAVIGNHDEGRNNCEDYKRICNNGEFRVLVNEIVEIEIEGETIKIFGADDVFFGEKANFGEHMTKDSFNIFLMHEGDLVDEMNNVDLAFAGHTHNGQINIPLGKKIVKPYMGTKYKYGYYKVDRGALIVSGGVGVTRLPIRLFAVPEVVVVKPKLPCC